MRHRIGTALKLLARLLVRLPVLWRVALWVEGLGTHLCRCDEEDL